jgi:purine-binding chemotaxis protein CheW
VSPGGPSLIAEAQSIVCAIPIVHVDEIMRPLPTETLAGMPSFVMGLAIVRGEPTPVVHLGAFLGGRREPRPCMRYVAVRVDSRRVALAVEVVHGVREVDRASAAPLPALLGEDNGDRIAAVGVVDSRLLVVLRAVRVVPAEVWEAMSTRRATS